MADLTAPVVLQQPGLKKRQSSWMRPTISSSMKKAGPEKMRRSGSFKSRRNSLFARMPSKATPAFSASKVARDKRACDFAENPTNGAAKSFACANMFSDNSGVVEFEKGGTMQMVSGSFVISGLLEEGQLDQPEFRQRLELALAEAVGASTEPQTDEKLFLQRLTILAVTQPTFDDLEVSFCVSTDGSSEQVDLTFQSVQDSKKIAWAMGRAIGKPPDDVQVKCGDATIGEVTAAWAEPPQSVQVQEVPTDNGTTSTIVAVHQVSGKHHVVIKSSATANMVWGLSDFMIPGSMLKPSSRALIHQGFLAEASRIIPELMQRYKDSVSCFVGHGLGGAVATVLAWYWPQATELITFGSPRVGDFWFVNEVFDNVKSTTRYRFNNDPVPSAPFPPRVEESWLNSVACCARARGPPRTLEHIGPSVHIQKDADGTATRDVFDEQPSVLSENDFLAAFQDHDISNYSKYVGFKFD